MGAQATMYGYVILREVNQLFKQPIKVRNLDNHTITGSGVASNDLFVDETTRYPT